VIALSPHDRVKELMQRVRKVVQSLPTQSDFELFTEEEERVSFEEEASDKFEVFTDDAFPGQFRVVGDKIEKVTLTTSLEILWHAIAALHIASQRYRRVGLPLLTP
jgi:hypothetical protein